MTDTPELLPCPFCGGDAVVTAHEAHEHSPILKRIMPDLPDHAGSFDASCLSCDIGVLRDTDAEAIAAWNRRTPATPAFNDHGCIYCRAQGSDCEGPHKFATPAPVSGDMREVVARAMDELRPKIDRVLGHVALIPTLTTDGRDLLAEAIIKNVAHTFNTEIAAAVAKERAGIASYIWDTFSLDGNECDHGISPPQDCPNEHCNEKTARKMFDAIERNKHGAA